LEPIFSIEKYFKTVFKTFIIDSYLLFIVSKVNEFLFISKEFQTNTYLNNNLNPIINE
jgi:hypothetical protein